VQPIVEELKKTGACPFLIDTNTLYSGSRTDAVVHLKTAYEHGFTHQKVGCPVIIGDGLRGENAISVEVNTPPLQHAHLCGAILGADALVSIAHVTAHLGTGIAATIKNLGMGLASRGGKLAQHSGVIPQVEQQRCVGCRTCVRWCPARAAHIDQQQKKMRIAPEKCIGCGECLAVCRQNAVKIAWDESSQNLQRKMAAYCRAVLNAIDGPAIYFNFLLNVTKDCDCMGEKQKPLIDDIGVLASADPVAIDQAAVDLCNQRAGQDLFRKCYPQIDYTVQLQHAEAIGLGTRRYSLIKLNL
jgi:hypothetical protein